MSAREHHKERFTVGPFGPDHVSRGNANVTAIGNVNLQDAAGPVLKEEGKPLCHCRRDERGQHVGRPINTRVREEQPLPPPVGYDQVADNAVQNAHGKIIARISEEAPRWLQYLASRPNRADGSDFPKTPPVAFSSSAGGPIDLLWRRSKRRSRPAPNRRHRRSTLPTQRPTLPTQRPTLPTRRLPTPRSTMLPPTPMPSS